MHGALEVKQKIKLSVSVHLKQLLLLQDMIFQQAPEGRAKVLRRLYSSHYEYLRFTYIAALQSTLVLNCICPFTPNPPC